MVRPREFQGPQTLSRQKAPVTNVYRSYGWSLWGGVMGRNLFSWFGRAIGWLPRQESAPKPEPQKKEYVATQKATPKKKRSAAAQSEFDFL